MEDQEVTLSNALSSSYMLATCTVRVYEGKKKDADAAAELLALHGADTDAGIFTKNLFKNAETELKECKAAYNKIRNWFYSNSLPWSASKSGERRGARLMSTVDVIDKLGEFANMKAEAEAKRDEFIKALPNAIAKAATSLNTLYKPEDYPDASTLLVLFDASLDVTPMHDVTDFDRLTIPAKLADGMKELYNKQANDRIEVAMHDMQQRTLEALGRMVESLTKVSEGKKGTKVYDSMVGNLQRMTHMMQNMNLSNDPEIAAIANEIQTKLLKHEANDYKGNASLAGVVASDAKAILEKLQPVSTVDEEAPAAPVQLELPEPEPEPEKLDVDSAIHAVMTGEATPDEKEVEDILSAMDFDDVFYSK